MKKEIWKPVLYENFCSEYWINCVNRNYEVSNLGRIRNNKTGKILNSFVKDNALYWTMHYNRPDYYPITLQFRVSHVVYGSFVGNCYDHKIYHKDNDIFNNSLDNLYM
jgi:hypothetical protein